MKCIFLFCFLLVPSSCRPSYLPLPLVRRPLASPSVLSPRGSGRWLSAAGFHSPSAAAPSPCSRTSSTSWCPPRTRWSWGTADDIRRQTLEPLNWTRGNQDDTASEFLFLLIYNFGVCFLRIFPLRFPFFWWFHTGIIKDSSRLNRNFCLAQISLTESGCLNSCVMFFSPELDFYFSLLVNFYTASWFFFNHTTFWYRPTQWKSGEGLWVMVLFLFFISIGSFVCPQSPDYVTITCFFQNDADWPKRVGAEMLILMFPCQPRHLRQEILFKWCISITFRKIKDEPTLFCFSRKISQIL